MGENYREKGRGKLVGKQVKKQPLLQLLFVF